MSERPCGTECQGTANTNKDGIWVSQKTMKALICSKLCLRSKSLEVLASPTMVVPDCVLGTKRSGMNPFTVGGLWMTGDDGKSMRM